MKNTNAILSFMLFFVCLSFASCSEAEETQSDDDLRAQFIENSIVEYRGKGWYRDGTSCIFAVPENFRTMKSPFIEDRITDKLPVKYPSTEGLADMHLSASRECSALEMQALVDTLRTITDGDIWLIDLRQESHFLANGLSVSWYGKNDWANKGYSDEECQRDEEARMKYVIGKTIMTYELDDDKNFVDSFEVHVTETISEQQRVEQLGVRYLRLRNTDHTFPKPESIDSFITLVRSLKQNDWIHIHCAAGHARTGVMMVLYDMMHNPSLPLNDIVVRQYLLGSSNMLETKTGTGIDESYQERVKRVRQLYDYVQEMYDKDYSVTWSEWIAQKDAENNQ